MSSSELRRSFMRPLVEHSANIFAIQSNAVYRCVYHLPVRASKLTDANCVVIPSTRSPFVDRWDLAVIVNPPSILTLEIVAYGICLSSLKEGLYAALAVLDCTLGKGLCPADRRRPTRSEQLGRTRRIGRTGVSGARRTNKYGHKLRNRDPGDDGDFARPVVCARPGRSPSPA